MDKRMKGFTCCGDCIHYNYKKHKCNLGASVEIDARNHFYDDCPIPDIPSEQEIRAKVIEEMKELVRGHKYTNAEDGTTIEEMLKDENTEKKYAWYLSHNQCCDWMLHRLDKIAEQMKEVGE